MCVSACTNEYVMKTGEKSCEMVSGSAALDYPDPAHDRESLQIAIDSAVSGWIFRKWKRKKKRFILTDTFACAHTHTLTEADR